MPFSLLPAATGTRPSGSASPTSRPRTCSPTDFPPLGASQLRGPRPPGRAWPLSEDGGGQRAEKYKSFQRDTRYRMGCDMTDDMRRLMIVRTAFSNPNQLSDSRELDEQKREITLRWPEQTRRAIVAVRTEHINSIKRDSLNFHSLTVVREADKEKVLMAAQAADAAMKGIDHSLSAKVYFIPLYVEQDASGDVYRAVVDAIRGRMFFELSQRLRSLAKLDTVPTRSRNALLKLCDRLRAWNVLDDPDVAATLESVKLQLTNGVIKPVLDDIEKSLAELKEKGAIPETDSDPPASTTEAA